jgi:hypothetical protein
MLNTSFLYRCVLLKEYASVNQVLKTVLTYQVLIYHVAKLQLWSSVGKLLVNYGNNKTNKESCSYKVCLEGQRIYVETLMTALRSSLESKCVKESFAGVFSKYNFGGVLLLKAVWRCHSTYLTDGHSFRKYTLQFRRSWTVNRYSGASLDRSREVNKWHAHNITDNLNPA